MTSKTENKDHHKHAFLERPAIGEFGRNELAFIGTNCGSIKTLAYTIINRLSTTMKVSYVDADHKDGDENEASTSAISSGADIEYTDKIVFQRTDFRTAPNKFERAALYNQQDLVLVNGNHFKATNQVLIIDANKPVEKKLDTLTDVRLVLCRDNAAIPSYVTDRIDLSNTPVLNFNDEEGIISFVKNFVQQKTPPLKALVLSGGRSTRMKMDKGNLSYFGTSQRQHVSDLLSKYGQTHVSCNREQSAELRNQFTIIEDAFLNLGPMGGILSALQSDPNAAWLTVACDLPFLTDKTIEYLVSHRNPSKCATAFRESNGTFPEPLITIWEPKSYPVLLQFLAQGYSCPRKALINSDIELLTAPNVKEFENVNFKDQYEQAMQQINNRAAE